jgi:1,2-diacylglycerol 3-alpha-glucosyltransferase
MALSQQMGGQNLAYDLRTTEEEVMGTVAIIYARFGPYHVARLKGTQAVLSPEGWQVFGIEVVPDDRFYAWEKLEGESEVRRIPLLPGRAYEELSRAAIGKAVINALNAERPDVVVCPGWHYAESLAAARWCRRNRKIAILMSESGRHDSQRWWWRELIKRLRLRLFDAALVGGSVHAAYLVELGMSHDRIAFGHNVVDNVHFARGAEYAHSHASQIRRELGLPERYILASGRFVPDKNFSHLLQTYRRYQEENDDPLPLVICGDGLLQADLHALADTLYISQSIHWPGFVQYEVLPYYYGLADYFVIPSMIEPWGLVVNEAMASGLPILVSNRCGCAPDLVQEGVNGFTFDPTDVHQLAALLARMGELEGELPQLGQASRQIISHWGPDRFAQGLWQAIRAAYQFRGFPIQE